MTTSSVAIPKGAPSISRTKDGAQAGQPTTGSDARVPPPQLPIVGSPTGRQPRYMQEFRCIGPECEDTCCKDWSISMSRKDYKRLKLIIGDEELGKRTRRKAAAQRPKEDWAPGYAVFLQQDGSCSYVTGAGLCQIHEQHGGQALTGVCGLYPRTVNQYDDRVEVVSTLACPEIARRCLLDSSAMELVDLDPPSEMSLTRPQLRLSGKKDGFRVHFDLVRDALLTILASRERPLSDRLATVAYLIDRLRPHLQRGKPADAGKLKAEVDLALSEKLQDELSKAFAEIPARGRAVHLLFSYVLNIYSVSAGSRMRRVLEDVRTEFLTPSTTASSSTDSSTTQSTDSSTTQEQLLSEESFAAALTRYEECKTRLERDHGQSIDTYFTNFCLNSVLRFPLLDQLDLFDYVAELIYRTATLRFLLLSQPRLTSGGELTKQLLDQTAVLTFQAFAREIEHSRDFSKKLHQLMHGVNARNLGELLCLTRL